MARSRGEVREEGRPRRSFLPGGCRPTLLLLAELLVASAVPADILDAEAVQADYRQILSVLSTGAEEGALGRLVDFEVDVLAGDLSPRRVEALWRQKLRVLRSLLENQPLELLEPVILLHHDAYLRYLEVEQPVLAVHSRTMAGELAEIYFERSGSPESGSFASSVLASFGLYLEESWSVSIGAEFLRRALQIDPRNQVARLALAAAYEKSGEYLAAARHLDQAVRVEPEHFEARLRWVLCLLRGRELTPEDAMPRLAGLGENPEAPDWVRSVAFQELVRLHLEAGDGAAARQAARRGVEGLPGDPQISLQLTFLLEKERRWREAAEVLDSVRRGDPSVESPRLLYDQWPTLGIGQERRSMRESAKRGLMPLAAGLLFAGQEIQGP